MVFVYTYSKTGGSPKSKADATWLLHMYSSNITIAVFYVINLILWKVVASTIYLSPYLCVLQVDFVFSVSQSVNQLGSKLLTAKISF